MNELAVKIEGAANHREMLIKCASTTLSSKLVNAERQFFSEMVVDAVSYLDERLPLNMIGIKKVSGGSITVSEGAIGILLSFPQLILLLK